MSFSDDQLVKGPTVNVSLMVSIPEQENSLLEDVIAPPMELRTDL
jgi:hypothetical protein